MREAVDAKLGLPDFNERYINTCHEVAGAFRSYFRKKYDDAPAERDEIVRTIIGLSCAQIENHRNEPDFAGLFDIIWYAALKSDLGRSEIDRVLKVVKIEAESGKLFSENN